MQDKKNDLAEVLYNRYRNRYEIAENSLQELQKRFAELGDKKSQSYAINVNDFDFSNRSLNCLLAEKIYTIGQLIELSVNDLSKIPNMGKRSIQEVREVLAAKNLCLRGDEGNGI
jgi:DNA-directed RNA polymerase alpha subunit